MSEKLIEKLAALKSFFDQHPERLDDLYMQNESPGKDQESNWLPAPKDDFNLILRMYWPKPVGAWKPPAVQRLK